MSAHVVVIDATARRATIKTTPTKHLTDILQEACTKLGYNASQYSLKHNRKQLDLSLSYRLSGLISGAKLELVQLSRSPSVVTVGLQLPESEARGAPNGRILDKFPSTTTLWMVLRKFEAGVAGTGPVRNLTSRAVPSAEGGDVAGRLYYEIPVLQILEREVSSFTDLQKTLAQLGYNSGNVLIRLSFRRTEEPIEEAMVKIGEFFKTSEDEAPSAQDKSAAPTAATADAISKGPAQDISNSLHPEPSNVTAASEVVAAPLPIPAPATSTADSGRSITVFSPPSEDTPSSAKLDYDENDYIPSIEHAKLHQRLLNESSRPKRLPTDAEIAAKAEAEAARRAAIHEVDVKIRFPDQSQVVAKFGTSDTGRSLYDFARECLALPFASENFNLTVHGVSRSKQTSAIPPSDKKRLIKDLGLAGRVLVNFSWADHAPAFVHERRAEILRPELRSQAQELKVEQPPGLKEEDSTGPSQPGPSSAQGGDKPSGARKSGAMPKWLKLPGKK
ncbi:GLUT4 regulating protein TUG [Penicillium cf. griseofulvum]|uniref:GLUT4 regulating protein TUG n=1 Tax=Penicillium cf. griseofulvum TaxID=2972120 RepID=A0A9W9M995_9EURO|nr:GLUT4 regulating protein TUG [Penicillium cf. griseofulvum]KAJ5445257.1 GLUT4 regulating protein TUG [Penicillium cf. griseofulvum]KAJ5446978.1 GLUT4 regulating protein TUG [Penicillium cf. griseofulvum]